MIQVRIHGRGGQGVVTAAELIALAAFEDGFFAQAFPFFGVERSGAPIQAFARIDVKPIITREQIYTPNYLIIQDKTLLTEDEILSGLKPGTRLIINSDDAEVVYSQLAGRVDKKNIFCLPATDIAFAHLGKNIVNTVMIGAFASISGEISLKSLLAAVSEKFNDKGGKIVKINQDAVISAFKYERKIN